MAADVTNVSTSYDVGNATIAAGDVIIAYNPPTHHPLIVAVYIFCYVLIFILGLSGNSVVVYIVTSNKHMQTITNSFILNLAFSDILLCLFAVPFTPLAYFLPSWPFGEALCRLVPMTLGVAVFVSTLTSVVIAVDR